LTVPVKPAAPAIWIVAVVGPPADVVRLVELEDKPNTIPVPLNAIVCGEPLALSVTVSVPVPAPAAKGLYVTEIVQFAPAATLVPQVLVWAKSPDAAIELSVRVAVPEFVSVIDCAALTIPIACPAKFRLVGESVTPGNGVPGATPVPLSATDWGESAALSVIVIVPEPNPAATGANVTVMVQVAPAATLEPQVFFWAKSPETAIDVIDNAALPEFVMVTVCAALVVPCTCWPKLSALGEIEANGPLTVSVTTEDVELPAA
jgi:hypothetical protein